MRKLDFTQMEIDKFIVNHVKLGLDRETMFGNRGEGFQRFNIACSRLYLEKALTCLEENVNKI
ncbi:MAG: aminotransferase class [Clostridiaceae bacterium]|jgi:cystathionine beta-lyase|nr:aminotransferase class [Clostridiaceae bacterium]